MPLRVKIAERPALIGHRFIPITEVQAGGKTYQLKDLGIEIRLYGSRYYYVSGGAPVGPYKTANNAYRGWDVVVNPPKAKRRKK